MLESRRDRRRHSFRKRSLCLWGLEMNPNTDVCAIACWNGRRGKTLRFQKTIRCVLTVQF